LLWLLT